MPEYEEHIQHVSGEPKSECILQTRLLSGLVLLFYTKVLHGPGFLRDGDLIK